MHKQQVYLISIFYNIIYYLPSLTDENTFLLRKFIRIYLIAFRMTSVSVLLLLWDWF